ncbi:MULTISPECIES: hypothetical protein [Amycolatopsis]|nr:MULTISPECIES: hypothetical protein [Amycolatopsis]
MRSRNLAGNAGRTDREQFGGSGERTEFRGTHHGRLGRADHRA